MKSLATSTDHNKSNAARRRKSKDPTSLLAQARKQLSWRPSFQESSSEEQEAQIASHARQLAIYNADIGRATIRIGELLELLTNEVEAFIERWPDASAARLAIGEALTDADLTVPSKYKALAHVGLDYFNYAPTELQTWLPVLQIILERLDGFAPPDTAKDEKEWKNQGRVAA